MLLFDLAVFPMVWPGCCGFIVHVLQFVNYYACSPLGDCWCLWTSLEFIFTLKDPVCHFLEDLLTEM